MEVPGATGVRTFGSTSTTSCEIRAGVSSLSICDARTECESECLLRALRYAEGQQYQVLLQKTDGVYVAGLLGLVNHLVQHDVVEARRGSRDG